MSASPFLVGGGGVRKRSWVVFLNIDALFIKVYGGSRMTEIRKSAAYIYEGERQQGFTDTWRAAAVGPCGSVRRQHPRRSYPTLFRVSHQTAVFCVLFLCCVFHASLPQLEKWIAQSSSSSSFWPVKNCAAHCHGNLSIMTVALNVSKVSLVSDDSAGPNLVA